MAGAIGLQQLKKLPQFLEQRRKNAEGFLELAQRRHWQVQKVPEWGKSSWFAFAIVTEEIEALKREFDEKGIQHRPIVAGNFTRSPSIAHYQWQMQDAVLANADRIHDNGIYIGNHHTPINWDIFN
jgi:CDP-6-deoxy-D-xylo-4-hexulose-3-dehydrase